MFPVPLSACCWYRCWHAVAVHIAVECMHGLPAAETMCTVHLRMLFYCCFGVRVAAVAAVAQYMLALLHVEGCA